MIGERDRIVRLGAEVLLVAYDEPSLLATKLLFEIKVPFELVLDRTKETYRRWGMGRTNIFRSVLAPALVYRYLKLLLKGERFLGVAPDMYQLGGDFVIDQSGRIVFAHRMRHNGDRVEVSSLLNELARVAKG
jgi:hypothetical protein